MKENMDPHKSILLQKQIRDNSEDLQKEFLDMEAWEQQMKKKDFQIRNANDNKVLPPVRSKKKNKFTPYSIDDKPNKAKRIASSDYKAWDKFDVEKACEEIEEEKTLRLNKEQKEFEIPSQEQLEKDHEKANKFKDEGNALVKKQEWATAIGKYNQAIKIFPNDAVFYANRALCQLKLNNLYSAEDDCTAAINLNSNYVKAYHRRASARVELERFNDARKDIETVIKLEPSNKEAKCMLAQVQERLKKQLTKKMDISGSSTSNIEKQIGEKLFKKISSNSKRDTNSDKFDHGNEEAKSRQASINENVFKQTIEHEDEPLKVGVEETETNDGLPPWLPELKGVVSLVEPQAEVPQKSKQAFKRIPIKELPLQQSIFKGIVEEIAVEKLEQPAKPCNIKSHVHSLNENNAQAPLSNSNDKNEPNVLINIPPPPKSAVAFLLDWRKNSSEEFRYKYLKQIDPNNLPDIFKESMESNIFSEILQTLNSRFIADDNVYDFLNCLSNLKRFRTLVLFMSSADKQVLGNLFKHCKDREGKTEDDIKNLHDTYEM